MYYFIINPNSRSGNGIKIWHSVKKELEFLQVSYTAYLTEYNLHATYIAEEICKSTSGVKNIVVLGGDGTINEVINGINDYDDVILGYIPSGSSNDLARSLGLPKDPIEGLKHILTPNRFQYVDTGYINDNSNDIHRKFSVSCGLGYDADTCVDTNRSKLKKVFNRYGLGKLTYIMIALKVLMRTSFVDADVTIDNKITKSYKQVLLITSMIHKYEGGGLKIAPSANPYDGNLSVCIVHGLSRLMILILLPTLLFGKHTVFKGVETFDCKTLEVLVNKPSAIHLDGEVPGTLKHMTMSCTTKQLRIIK